MMNTRTLKTLAIISWTVLLFPLAPAEEEQKPNAATWKVFQTAQELQKDGKNKEAEALLNKAITDGNNHTLLHMGLVASYVGLKDFKKASESYREVWSRTGNLNMLEGYSVALVEIQDIDRLREIKETLITNFDKLKEGRLGVLMVAANDGDQDLFNRAIAKIPTEEIRKDEQLARVLALTSQKLAKHAFAAKDNSKAPNMPEQTGSDKPSD